MAVLKIKSVPQKYTDELAYQQLLDYIMRSDKTPDHYIGGFAVHPQYAAEEMQLVSQAYHQDRGVRLRHWIISFEKHEFADACTQISLRRWRADFTQIHIKSSIPSMKIPSICMFIL